MTIFRYAQDLYGQTLLLGASWNLLFWFAGVAIAFSILHILYKLLRREPERQVPALPVDEANQRIVRHTLSNRLYHWLLAVSVITLMVTAFGPRLGWLFNWVTIHWAVGVVLTVLVIYHIARSIVRRDLKTMRPNGDAIPGGMDSNASGAQADPAPRGGKYKLTQMAYHWAIAGLILLLILTGAAILSKMDTPLWRRNPYWLSDQSWGIIYAIHDLAAMCILAGVIVHIYFALRPENFWMLRSMTRGWLTKREYLSHHDATLRRVDQAAGAPRRGSGSDISPSASQTP